MNKVQNITTTLLSFLLGGFFIFKGVKKHFLSPCKVFDKTSTIPIEYQQVVTHLCESGFTTMVGFLQVLTGILLLIPKTRVLGAILLMPIIISIFSLHYFLDNRPHELVETGIPLAMNIAILLLSFNRWKSIFNIEAV